MVRTAAERYLRDRKADPEYGRVYTAARQCIDQIDELIRALDQRRCSLQLSKAELARRAGLRPEVVRRLFSAESPNPTLSTVVALAGALKLKMTTEPREERRAGRGRPGFAQIQRSTDRRDARREVRSVARRDSSR